ncbi:MAG: gene transfer agent family protein [Sphingomonadaceae bacterium]|nr:gene transfer agent family protein [Sphingomonadaceae bacterium]
MTQTSPATHIDLPFADGIYSFRLGLAQIAELQAKCGVGIGGLYARLLRGRYVIDTLSLGLTTEADFHLADVIEPIRQGLIGGRRGEVDGQPVEVSSIVAVRLVENHLCGKDGSLHVPLREAWNLAVAIMAALIEGYTPKKAEPAVAPAGETAKEETAGADATTDGSTMPAPSPTA